MHTEFRIQRILLKLTQVGAGFDSGIRRQSSSAIPVSLTLRRQGGNFGLTIWRQNAELYFTLSFPGKKKRSHDPLARPLAHVSIEAEGNVIIFLSIRADDGLWP